MRRGPGALNRHGTTRGRVAAVKILTDCKILGEGYDTVIGIPLDPEADAILDAAIARFAPKSNDHIHRNVCFHTPAEHDRALADGAIRAMVQLLERTNGREPALGFRHILSALLEAMGDLRKEM